MTGQQGELPFEAGPTGIDAILAETADRIDELYRAAKEPGATPPWADLFNRIARHTHMAPFNLMLADIQRPGARYVAFPEKWREIGREVKPGSVPIVVLWPFCPVRCAYELADTTGSKEDDAVLDRVFGEPLEAKAGISEKLARRAQKEDQIATSFVKMASSRGGDAQVIHGPTAEKGKPAAARWLVRISSDLNQAARFKVLVHELAHIYVGHLGGNGKKWPSRRPEGLDAREFEAEAVSFIVGRRFGLHTNSAEYLTGYVKDNTLEHVSFSAIARAAGRIEQHAR
jgi:hypothetical protein